MSVSNSINLTVNSDDLEKFCNKLIKRSRDIAKTHDAMVTLESFISLFAKGAQGTEEYRAIESLINTFTEKTRQKLLQEKAEELLLALRHRDLDAIISIYVPLSRSGFRQIVEMAVSQLTNEEISFVRNWSSEWVRVAKQKAEEASGYPDALDFNKSGVSIEAYQAMTDLGSYIT